MNVAILGMVLLGPFQPFAPAHQANPAKDIQIRECLVIRSVGQSGRSATHTDAIEAQIVSGKWMPPKAGDQVALPDGRSQTWTTASADKDDWIANPALNGGYAYIQIDSPIETTVILEAAGHNMVYFNGEPRMGDPYSYGYVKLPVHLKQGANQLIFSVGRGKLRARLVAPRKPVMLDVSDATLPDLIPGERGPKWGAIVVINATNGVLARKQLVVHGTNIGSAIAELPEVAPMSIRKVGFRIGACVGTTRADAEAEILLADSESRSGAPIDSAKVNLRVREPGQTYKRTFISQIDGSVQYYAVNPASKRISGPVAISKKGQRPTTKTSSATIPTSPSALFLSLHGASVEAIGQADAYSAKNWGDIVCPTNRRPYGFDWEDWGRLDALEVLGEAKKTFNPDPSRIYLTGHSMGGHGTWQVGVTYPGLFAAIGPSAAWISFQSYGGGRRSDSPSSVQAMLRRAANPSDTLGLVNNLAQNGVYVLHGADDDNVPVSEARTMAAKLNEFHHDWTYFEQPKAGHWWDNSDEPGADCVDWAPMFDLFARHALPAEEDVRQVDFVTMSPGVSAWNRWAAIEQQIHPLQPGRISIRVDPWQRRFVGTTENVQRIAVRLSALSPEKPFRVELDGVKMENLPWPAFGDEVRFVRTASGWAPAGRLPRGQKGPHRYGPFKEVFQSGFFLVYGTKGSPEENAWAFDKARFDAEQWYYRGNGAVDVFPDTEFQSTKEIDRSVILYGNSETNAAWTTLLSKCPVLVSRTGIKVGERDIKGGELACLLLFPRTGSDVACVGAVSGTGVTGMRLTDRLPYFVSGVAYPDLTIVGPEMLNKGADGVRAAGFFGNDWKVETGEFVWGQ